MGCVSKFAVFCIQTGHTYLLPRRFVEGCGEGASFYILPVRINTLIGFKAVPQVGYWILIYKHHRKQFLSLVFYIIFGTRGTKSYWVNPWPIFGGLLGIDI